MSAQKTYSISCPKCGGTQNVELYDSINTAQEPDLRAALMENRLNRVECVPCSHAFRVDKPLLYHDPDREILIHWMPETAVSREEILDEFDRAALELRAAMPDGVELPRIRLVFSRVELIELIFLLEAGMEERVVEYIKYTMYTRNPGKLPPEAKQLLLNVQDSTVEELMFVVQDVATQELETILCYSREKYRSLRDLYTETPDEFTDLFPGPCISARAALLEEQISG